MKYEFRRPNGKTVTVSCPFADVDDLFKEMAAKGFTRVYAPPQIVIYPGWTESMEESVQAHDDMVAQARRDGAQAMDELREIIRDQ